MWKANDYQVNSGNDCKHPEQARDPAGGDVSTTAPLLQRWVAGLPIASARDPYFLYSASNLLQYLSRLHKPFSTGMLMLFDKAEFDRLGGFHEQALYAEDYHLSRKVERGKFGIVWGRVLTTPRRFRRMGHRRVISLFLSTAFNGWNEGYFLRDHNYWESQA